MANKLFFRDQTGKQYEIGIEHSNALGHWYLAVEWMTGSVRRTEILAPRYPTQLGARAAARRYAEFHGWTARDG
ncbi:hypothetical protein [Novosphingobium humi]|uniref:Uncharacterized protein n=1 Tax=Novosphingobium humi TaxID=2282397 RepID=A0ABY7TZE9_9SPHN|nr:hypothetical protein [Novosphingobium humi]WCT78647.1 hypothetical protein PQ457_06705 [Novosphingobium humi]